MLRRAEPILKGRVIETLATRFHSRVELDSLHVSVMGGLEVSGDGLRIFAPDEVVAAGAVDPILSVSHFNFHSKLRDLFFKPMHVGTVHVAALSIHIPPHEQRAMDTTKHRKQRGKIKIVVEELVIENSELVIGTIKPDKEPKRFSLQYIRMRDIGPDVPWRYETTLINAIPRGNIHAIGTFGPWNIEEPGSSSVTGDYSFDNADLNTIKGIGGMLHSTGKFSGQLDRIVADGRTTTPDFSLDTGKHKMSLETTFHAVIDGTSGDTYLEPVHAKLGSSEFTCSGKVVNIKQKGHITDLDIDVPGGELRDFLLLAVKTTPPLMNAKLGMKVHLTVPPGRESITQKLQMEGKVSLRHIHFNNPKVQDRIDGLSLRAQGHPDEAKPGAEDVSSRMQGKFFLRDARLDFPLLSYSLPGASIRLHGIYSLDGKQFNFHGKVRTEATISHMIATRWKSWLLRPVDPFFKKNGAGAEIPVKITGTQEAPKFGLDLHQKDSSKE